jgi:transcriptional regulator with XRE-family HTH domain
MTTFARNLHWLRTQRSLDQKDVAQIVGVQPHTVSDWECGKRVPNWDNLERLQALFGDTAMLDLGLITAYDEVRKP